MKLFKRILEVLNEYNIDYFNFFMGFALYWFLFIITILVLVVILKIFII